MIRFQVCIEYAKIYMYILSSLRIEGNFTILPICHLSKYNWIETGIA
jgi:hypothetical protein